MTCIANVPTQVQYTSESFTFAFETENIVNTGVFLFFPVFLLEVQKCCKTQGFVALNTTMLAAMRSGVNSHKAKVCQPMKPFDEAFKIQPSPTGMTRHAHNKHVSPVKLHGSMEAFQTCILCKYESTCGRRHSSINERVFICVTDSTFTKI